MESVNAAIKMTVDEYLRLDDETRYELIEGELLMVPSPSFTHQAISRNLEFIIWHYVDEHKKGEVLYAPFDVILDEETVVQPDLLYISAENLKHLKKEKFYGVPDIVIEIVSPSSYSFDHNQKKEMYERFSVPEYWLVDPLSRVIIVYAFDATINKFIQFSSGVETQQVSSKVLPELKIELSRIFR